MLLQTISGFVLWGVMKGRLLEKLHASSIIAPAMRSRQSHRLYA